MALGTHAPVNIGHHCSVCWTASPQQRGPALVPVPVPGLEKALRVGEGTSDYTSGRKDRSPEKEKFCAI